MTHTDTPGVLISVRDAAEATLVANSSASVIDIKEPLHGALGAAELATIVEICGSVSVRQPISVALGELLEPPRVDEQQLPSEVHYAKYGLAHCADEPKWLSHLTNRRRRLPPHVAPVAVVYADAAARAPDAEEIIAAAMRLNCRAVLVDTFDKSAGDLFCHWSPERLRDFTLQVTELGMVAVVAGGLTVPNLPDVVAAAPNWLGVRGAVCDGARAGTICADRLTRFLGHVAACRADSRIMPTGPAPN